MKSLNRQARRSPEKAETQFPQSRARRQTTKPSTIHEMHATLSGITTEAVKREMVASNPSHSTRRNDSTRIKRERRKIEFLPRTAERTTR